MKLKQNKWYISYLMLLVNSSIQFKDINQIYEFNWPRKILI